MEPYRERIEDFLRRYGRALAVAVTILLALLVLRRLRVLASLVRIGALLWAVVLVAMAVTSVGFLQAPTYEAYALVLVGEEEEPWYQQTNLAGSGEMILTDPKGLQAFIGGMVNATGSRTLAEETPRRLGLRMEPAELLDNLTVEQVETTNFLRLRYEDTDPERATQIVNTVGEVSSELISERGSAGSQLTAAVFDKAAVPESPVGPHPWRNGLLTLVVGWTLTGLVILAHRTERRKP